MNNRIIVVLIVLIAAVAFGSAAFFYKSSIPPAPSAEMQPQTAAFTTDELIRPYSPIIGRMDAPVTLVEFLDPSCEACRAFYPVVHEILTAYPEDVRLVVRFAPFHQGSDIAVGILAAAKDQNVFEPVLEALFRTQPEWAVHGAPNLDKAWEAAAVAGLDLERGKAFAARADVAMMLQQEMDDVKTHNVRQTPTFFVNGKPLAKFGPDELKAAVAEEVEKSKN